ncbi:bifunctional helix-turn-helix transcriptional regulator/GNAT family N-acetyltransferase [Rhizobium rhizophilum]|uniref:MarR family transcriptional regulator n=1 Tax=Rhizobium rhizophilum TaxID=1850373 RepID=A0ABY2QV52_9HYPH|nr:helix-turn-helix domain-containing GNAT family N-acetyltransferase [Rhizobium rhizophilum]THV13714.1 MarR family transcriptional regulator [Rhizobium rhizophilum]
MLLSDIDVDSIRSTSRQLVRRLGFLRSDLAESGLPPSSVHALIEIGTGTDLSGRDLSEILGLDKSSISRLLGKLQSAGLITETVAPTDARTKHLSLTADGAKRLVAIEAFARDQVRTALARLTTQEQHIVRTGLELYAGAIGGGSADGNGATAVSVNPATPRMASVQSGWRPGLLGRCIEMHARHYSETSGFGGQFEAIVAGGLAEFATRLDRPCNAIWAGLIDERIVGTIAIDGEDLKGTTTSASGARLAHLRLFIVDPSARGSGLGKALLQEALQFVDTQDFSETHLWTFRGLDTARRLYEASGFRLVEERPGSQWGAHVLEQRFVRERNGRLVRTAGIEPA